MTTSVSSKGQIVLPAEIRRQDGIQTGQKFEVERLAEGEYRLVRKKITRTKGLVAWLRSCPMKGFMQGRINFGTTDDLPRRR